MADKAMGMLVDYDYCTGCHSCEVSCKERFDMAEDEWGIKLADNGHGVTARPTGNGTTCPSPPRNATCAPTGLPPGKKALCEQHCQALVITVGPLDELAKKMTKKKMVLFNHTNDEPRKKAIY